MPARDLFPEDRRFLMELKKRDYRPATVYDVGASTGVWSDLVRRIFPEAEIHLFEPLAGDVDEYRSDLRFRTSDDAKLHLHTVALGRENTSRKMFATHDAYGSSLLDRGEVPEVREEVAVPVRRLDDYRREKGLPPPELMKLDCQGAELEVLDGAPECLGELQVLMAESWLIRSLAYGPDTPLVTELMEYLRRRGFACMDFGQHFYDETGRLNSVDVYFVAEAEIEEIWMRPAVTRKIAALYEEITHLETELRDRDRKVAHLRGELKTFHERYARDMETLRESWSWRLTAPLRWFGRRR